ncbi:alanine:cation symporter family protein [Synechococcus sp. A10-1-5-9]
MTVLAATIDAGGQGTVFWMWLAALLGITTKYFECMLAGFGIGNGV